MSVKLIVQRDSAYVGNLRKFKIVVDGEVIGRVADGKTQSFEIKPGDHILCLKLDWGRSAKIPFRADESGEVHFRCASNMTGGRVLLVILYATVWSHKLIKLERVTAETPAS